MKPSRTFLALVQCSAALCALLNPQLAMAYDHPLPDEVVREAYSIGQDVKTVNTFLSQYVQSLRVPHDGARVAQIELATPFAQVVEVSAQHSVGYSG